MMKDKSKKIKDKSMEGFLSEFASFNPAPRGGVEGGEMMLWVRWSDSLPKNPCLLPRRLRRGRGSPFILYPLSSQKGFTLLETVVALAVILAAVVGPVSLITRGLLTFSFSKNKVIATNLTQEGIELVRLVRENNVACDTLNGPAVWPWNRDPEGGVLTRARVGVDVTSFASIVCGKAVTISTPRLSASCAGPLLFENDPLLDNYGTYGYRSGIATAFFRCVEITSPPDGPDTDIPASAQMDVVSTVRWNERGTERSVVLRERLYDWR